MNSRLKSFRYIFQGRIFGIYVEFQGVYNNCNCCNQYKLDAAEVFKDVQNILKILSTSLK